jgi:hypothetical protein
VKVRSANVRQASGRRYAWASTTVAEGQGPAGAGTRFEIEKSQSRADGTAGAAMPRKPTDPTSWDAKLPW